MTDFANQQIDTSSTELALHKEDPDYQDVLSDTPQDAKDSDSLPRDCTQSDGQNINQYDEDHWNDVPDLVAPELDVPELVSQRTVIDHSVFTWEGQRPFAGAVEQYKVVLADALTDAKQHLIENPNHEYAKVMLPMFSTLSVDTYDQFGNHKVKKFAFHEAHYGPHIRIPGQGRPTAEQKWANFLHRYVYIWTLLGQDGKAPGGDGTGRGGTACAPFRDAQISLLGENLYLMDGSNIAHDAQKGTYWYNIHIAIYRNPPRNGPFRAPHGYGFIPYLGPAFHPMPQLPAFYQNVVPLTKESTQDTNQHTNQPTTQEQDIVQKERADRSKYRIVEMIDHDEAYIGFRGGRGGRANKSNHRFHRGRGAINRMIRSASMGRV